MVTAERRSANLLSTRPSLDDLDLSLGKRTRLHRMLYDYGPGGGTLLILPVDQGLEHGPRDFFANEESLDPAYEAKLAGAGGYSGIALQYGLASKYMRQIAGSVPLILKLNGRTEIPPSTSPRSPLTSRVEDAVRLGADAVGYTLYVGSAQQEQDFETFSQVRLEAERAGMPVVVWAYPRGSDVDAKGGRDSLYAIDYAARVAAELGADVVKVNYPTTGPVGVVGPTPGAPKPYDSARWSLEEAVAKVVRSAGRTLVIMSGGDRVDDGLLLTRVEVSLAAGATGFIFGRNIWQRPYDQALSIVGQIKDRMAGYAVPSNQSMNQQANGI
ncbi:MAG: fructose-bisphosphate aldolase [Chloroflexi bacterium]|nr:fructose-bisphosphate aldolase [Chloroflexota bacterium]